MKHPRPRFFDFGAIHRTLLQDKLVNAGLNPLKTEDTDMDGGQKPSDHPKCSCLDFGQTVKLTERDNRLVCNLYSAIDIHMLT